MMWRWTLFILVFLVTTSAQAETKLPVAYQQTAMRSGLPADVLYAIALNESGRTISNGAYRPWPWTLNIQGKGHFYSNKKEARQALEQALAEGINNVDIGLMQINWHHHHHRFSDPVEALDPYTNLKTASQILTEYWHEKKDLWAAIGRYHSTNPERSDAYRMRFGRNLMQALGATTPKTEVAYATHP